MHGAVVELIEELAWKLPGDHPLHPVKAAGKDQRPKAPVSLRGYQTYERGGGIIWEKAKLLAQVLQMDVQMMMHGPRPDTPDLSRNGDISSRSDQDTLADVRDELRQLRAEVQQLRDERAAGIQGLERLVRDQDERLKWQDGMLRQIEAGIKAEQAAKREAQGAAQELRGLLDALAVAIPALSGAAQPTATTPGSTAR